MDFPRHFGIIKPEASEITERKTAMDTFSKNLRRQRTAKHMTQEQTAQALDISPQTVSRWECGTSQPDIAMLPRLARLYGVTIDDLYRESAVAYENYAQRLAGIFESTLQPEDFLHADREFRKLPNPTPRDLRLYGILHQNMMYVCKTRALELFDRVLAMGPGPDPETYWATRRQKVYFRWEIGQNQENIDEFLPLVEGGSSELQDWLCLIQAYSFAKDYDCAWHWTTLANDRFPENATLHICTGDLLRAMGRHEEAFPHWHRARELEPDWLDAAWSIAECHEELGRFDQAAAAYDTIASELTRLGFSEELTHPRQKANLCRERLAN